MTSATDKTPSFDLASRVEPPPYGDETATLLGFLDYQRNTFRVKTGGLTAEQLAIALPPSPMTLGGMMKHVALNEVSWFSESLHGDAAPEPWASVDWEADRDWEWHTAAQDSPAELAALLDESVRIADDGIARAMAGDGFDTRAVREDRESGEAFSLRWIVTHMIEEYARHNGHADLIRESIDGETGE